MATQPIAQYLTVGGATVDIQPADLPNVVYTATCTGCVAKQVFSSGDARNGTHADYAVRQVVAEARLWAQPHAAMCRAIPQS